MSQLLLRLLQETLSIDPSDKSTRERLARVAEFKKRMLDKAGGVLGTKEVREMLGYKSAQAVHKAVASKRLLAIDDNGSKLYPAFQFEGASILTGMRAVLEAAPSVSPWSILRYMVVGDDGLGSDLPMDLIRQGDEAIDRAVRSPARYKTDPCLGDP
jgi:hypothetical protein